MRVGIANKETWMFLQDIYEYLAHRYPIQLYKPTTWNFPIMQQKMSQFFLRESLKKFLKKCDVVLFEWASEYLVEASQFDSPSALVTRLHRYEMFLWTEYIQWEAVNYAILNTQAMRQKLLSRTNLPPERAVVIPPTSISPDNYCYEPRPFQGNIGILCNLTPRKRVYELILAFQVLLKEMPGLHLSIGGGEYPRERDYYEALLSLVSKLNLEDRITFHGRVNERWNWYRDIDIFVSFSYSEGMQVAPLEAAASGCYCLSHWWDGAEEIFPIDQLFLSETDFVKEALRYCSATEEERRVMRDPVREFVIRECNFNRVTANVEALMIKAANEGNLKTQEKR